MSYPPTGNNVVNSDGVKEFSPLSIGQPGLSEPIFMPFPGSGTGVMLKNLFKRGMFFDLLLCKFVERRPMDVRELIRHQVRV